MSREMFVRTAIGQDSHRFAAEDTVGKCILGGIIFPDAPAFLANSDGDVVLHAVTNAVSGITAKNVLGARADALCRSGIRDSEAYLAEALRDLSEMKYRPVHLSVSIEGARPKIAPHVEEMRENIARILGLAPEDIGVTATTGEGLTAFGRGEGVSVFAILTAAPEA